MLRMTQAAKDLRDCKGELPSAWMSILERNLKGRGSRKTRSERIQTQSEAGNCFAFFMSSVPHSALCCVAILLVTIVLYRSNDSNPPQLSKRAPVFLNA